jgi:hypothetical protein
MALSSVEKQDQEGSFRACRAQGIARTGDRPVGIPWSP